ncbi:MAG: TRAP transporter large permease [Lachnospiraceae bacterium]|jgi:C4-dicarboxylate transporter DctM subunit|nr:TRAP transporter large permease [Lachnospiraceae bacterium]
MVLALFVIFFVLIILGIPIGVSIGLAVFSVILCSGQVSCVIASQALIRQISSFSLVAIPFFMLAGEIMEKSGITQKLVDFADAVVGWITGGLAYVAIFTGILMGGISGSGPADTAALGGIMIPSMIKSGYPKNYSAAALAASGSIGAIIPPSITMVVLAGILGESVGAMLMAGLVPGILIGLLMMLVSGLICHYKKYAIRDKSEFSWEKLGRAFVNALIPMMAPLMIVGGIVLGIFTATEASVVVSVYTLIIGLFVYRTIKLRDLKEIFSSAIVSSANVLLIIGVSAGFSWVLTYNNFPSLVTGLMLGISTNKFVIVLLVNIIFLVGGMFMEGLALILMFVPIFQPIMAAVGVNPMIFGVMVLINVVIGTLTPPVGVCLFVSSSISGEKVTSIGRAVLPFVGCMVLVMFLVVLLPDIVMFVPRLAGLAG